MPMYDNPAAFLADPSTASEQLNPVMHGMLASMRAFQQYPFMQQMLQQTQMNTQKQQTELQEFQSPQAQQQRQAQRQQIIDEGNIFHESMSNEINKAKEAERLRPYMTNKQIEEAKHDSQTAQHAFKTAPSTYFAGLFPALEQLKKNGMPEDQIKGIYDNLVKNSGFDLSNMDDDVKEYKPTTMGALAAHRYAMIHTPDFEQKSALEGQRTAGSLAVAATNVAGRLAETKANIAAGKYDNLPRYEVYLNRLITDGKDPDTGEVVKPEQVTEAKSALRRIKGVKILEMVNKDPAYQNAAIMSMTGDPKAVAAMRAAQQDATQRAMRALNITPEELGEEPKPSPQAKPGQSVTVGGKSYSIIRMEGGYAIVKDGNQERKVKLH